MILKRRHFTLLFLISGFIGLTAQLTVSANNTGYLPVNTYAGATKAGLLQVRISAINTTALNVDEWSLYVRSEGVIDNGEGKNVPPQKLHLQVAGITGQQPNDQGELPNIGTVQPDQQSLSLSSVNGILILNSPYDLKMGPRFLSLIVSYDVSLEGGSYLTEFSSWNNYRINLVFEFRDKNDQLLQSAPVFFDAQIHPNDAPPPSDNYTLQVAPAAKNVELNFVSAADYEKGVSRLYKNALTVVASGDYTLSVESASEDLDGLSGAKLPVGAISLESTTELGGSGATIPLSTQKQTLGTGTGTGSNNPIHYDLKFFTAPKDSRFFDAAKTSYSGTLLFTLTPQ